MADVVLNLLGLVRKSCEWVRQLMVVACSGVARLECVLHLTYAVLVSSKSTDACTCAISNCSPGPT